MKKIFLLEDDESLGEILSERLKKESLHVVWNKSIAEGLRCIQHDANWDLALLDVGLPDGSGFDFAETLQKYNYEIPFMFLTAQSDAENRLKGYEIGAHEFIPKPFHLKELIIRLNHVLKAHAKSDHYELEHSDVRVSELIVIHKTSGRKHILSANEMKLLDLLIRKSPKVVHRDEVMDVIWGEDKELSQRTIDNMILKIRSALEEDQIKIKTVRGIGYQFIN
ncbi:MAG: response regulator transcription factor [Pseudobdellovibrio sp.]